MRRREFVTRLLSCGFLLTALVLSLPDVAHAEPQPADIAGQKEYAGLSEELELIKEEESVGIPSCCEESSPATSIAVFVVTDEHILHSGATDLAAILRHVPGLDVTQRSASDIDVRIRGNHRVLAERILLLVNGFSTYNHAHGTVNWKILPVALPEIKRVEVLTGQAAVAFGFVDFDCVINIVTKSMDKMPRVVSPLGRGGMTSGDKDGDLCNQRAQ